MIGVVVYKMDNTAAYASVAETDFTGTHERAKWNSGIGPS